MLYVGVSVMGSKEDVVGLKTADFTRTRINKIHTCTEYVITVLEWVIIMN